MHVSNYRFPGEGGRVVGGGGGKRRFPKPWPVMKPVTTRIDVNVTQGRYALNNTAHRRIVEWLFISTEMQTNKETEKLASFENRRVFFFLTRRYSRQRNTPDFG
ncbi:MAG: hypothetical protein ACKN9V_09890 [Pseudomonadota bacterium]